MRENSFELDISDMSQGRKIVIGADHGAYELKGTLNEYLTKQGFVVEDVGGFNGTVSYHDV